MIGGAVALAATLVIVKIASSGSSTPSDNPIPNPTPTGGVLGAMRHHWTHKTTRPNQPRRMKR
jgi:hypothetical protein